MKEEDKYMGILTTIGAMFFFGLVGTGATVAIFDYHKKHGILSTFCVGFALQFHIIALYQLFHVTGSFLRDLQNHIEPQTSYKPFLTPLLIGVCLYAAGLFFSTLHNKKYSKG